MRERLKIRLVGLLVILCLISISLPFWLSEPKIPQVNYDIEVPPAPELPPTEPFDDIKARLKDAHDARKNVHAHQNVDAWVIQAGSFKNEDNAIALLDKLKGTMSSFSETVIVDDKPVYRVYVGPTLSKQVALKMKSQLKQDFDTEGLLLTYHPIKESQSALD